MNAPTFKRSAYTRARVSGRRSNGFAQFKSTHAIPLIDALEPGALSRGMWPEESEAPWVADAVGAPLKSDLILWFTSAHA